MLAGHTLLRQVRSLGINNILLRNITVLGHVPTKCFKSSSSNLGDFLSHFLFVLFCRSFCHFYFNVSTLFVFFFLLFFLSPALFLFVLYFCYYLIHLFNNSYLTTAPIVNDWAEISPDQVSN